VISELNKGRITYAITGATATSYYGIPRTTADIDFVARVSPKDLSRFTGALEKAGLKVDREKIKRQLRTERNVVTVPDKTSHYRADFIFQKGRLHRRKGSLLGLTTFYQPRELLILAKLRRIKATILPEKSIKDKNDIVEALANTRVNVRKIRQIAKRESTVEIFNGISEEI